MFLVCFLFHTRPSFQNGEETCQALDIEFEKVDLNESIDEDLEDYVEEENHELESMSYEDDNEDLDPEIIQVLQERMDEYKKSCMELAKNFKGKDIHLNFCDQGGNLYEM